MRYGEKNVKRAKKHKKYLIKQITDALNVLLFNLLDL